MDGVDGGWITTSGTDLIRYVLQPGNYTFGPGLAIPIMRQLKKQGSIYSNSTRWQHWWFKTLAVVIIVGFIAHVIYNYSRRKYLKKIKQLELEHKIQLERERISRDLHDNLGAYATAIVNTVDKVVKNLEDNTRLYNLKDNASEIMTKSRDTIWALNKNNISTVRLSERLKTYLQKIRNTYPHLKVELQENINSTENLSPEFALNLLRIIHESLHNSIKHSSGDRITIILNIGDQLYVSIRDNGSGFTDVNNTSVGNGFENMRTRAKENNIKLKISSTADEGTTIELFSPLQ